MRSMHKGVIMLFFWLILLPTFAFAESGCFLYAESNLYCLDIDEQQAQEECSLFEDCNLEQAFSLGETCTNSANFPECQRVLCKSSCQQEFVGKCGAGALAASEREEWCSPGCCRFTSRNQNHCSYTSNKWFCVVEVRNSLASEFNFDSYLLEPECNQQCIIANTAGEDVTAGLLLENASAESSPDVSSSSSQISSRLPSSGSTVSPEQLLSGPSKAVLGVILSLIALLSFFYYWHQKNIPGSFFSKKLPLPDEKEERSLHPFLPFLLSPQARARLEQSKLNHAHKVKHKQREEVLLGTGLKPATLSSAEFKKLQQLIKFHEHRKRLSPDQGRSSIQRLQKRISPPPRKPVNSSSLSNADQQVVLSKLRKLARK